MNVVLPSIMLLSFAVRSSEACWTAQAVRIHSGTLW